MIIINGNVENEKIILDNGYYFGRGVFETILVKDRPIFLSQHCERLKRGLSVLNISAVIDEDYITRSVEQYNIHDCILKVVVTEKNIVLSTRQSVYKPEDYIRGFKVKFSKLKRNPYSHTTYLKSLNYTDNVLEKEKAAQEGFDEVLFLNTNDELAEGSISNVFLVKDNKIFTPEVGCGILDGIVRGWVLDNFEVCEGRYTIEDVKKADEVFITNSVMGIMKVDTIDGFKKYESNVVYEIVRNKYEELIL